MIVCVDCRKALPEQTARCAACGWQARMEGTVLNFLSSKDRASEETSEYIETYDALAERNLSRPVEANDYVESLAIGCAQQIGSVEGKDVCDVGSGRGFFVKLMLEAKARSVTAVDIAAPALAKVAETYGVRSFLANAENLPFEREFDVLVATDIVEHVLNVSNFLVSANWALRDNGLLVVRVPYLENMIGYSNFFGLPMHYTHLRTYDKRVIVRTVEDAGFKVERVFYDGFRFDYMNRFWDRMPAVKARLQTFIRDRYGRGNITNLNKLICHILMKPIEVGVVARKVNHIDAQDYHADLKEFYDNRKSRSQDQASHGQTIGGDAQ